MKNMYKILLLSTLISGVSASYALGIPFTEMDADKNDTVSEQEFNTAKEKRIEARALEGQQMRGLRNVPVFTDIDTNKDGQLTTEEVATMQQARMQTRPDQGIATRNAAPGMRGIGMRRNQSSFADIDTNNDNYITKQEFYDARDKRIAERAKQGFAMRGLATAPTFTDVDSNNDGKVSQDEFMAQQQHMQNQPANK